MAAAVAAQSGARPRVVARPIASELRVSIADVTFTGSYATGGETIDPKQVGLRRILEVLGSVTEAAGQTTCWAPHWDAANGKLKLFGAGTGATGLTEHAAAAYAASTVGHLTFIGV